MVRKTVRRIVRKVLGVLELALILTMLLLGLFATAAIYKANPGLGFTASVWLGTPFSCLGFMAFLAYMMVKQWWLDKRKDKEEK